MKILLFLALFGAAVLLSAGLAASRRKPLASGATTIGPLLPGIAWFYGVFFSWGNGIRVEQYFNVRRLDDYLRSGNELYTGLLCALGLIVLAAGFVLARRARGVVLNPALGLLVLAAWYLCGFLIRNIPFEVLDWRTGNPAASFAQWVTWSPAHLLAFFGSLALALVAAIAAIAITRHAARKAMPAGAASDRATPAAFASGRAVPGTDWISASADPVPGQAAGLHPTKVLNEDERRRATLAFSRGMIPGVAICFIGTLLNVLFARASIAVPILSLVLIAIGGGVAIAMGLKRRRAFIATLSSRPTPADPGAR
jgi:hypothetical protein